MNKYNLLSEVIPSESILCECINVYKYTERKDFMEDCSTCAYCSYDEDIDAYVCDMYLDEDEYARFMGGHYKKCPYYRDGDEYKIARKQ